MQTYDIVKCAVLKCTLCVTNTTIELF